MSAVEEDEIGDNDSNDDMEQSLVFGVPRCSLMPVAALISVSTASVDWHLSCLACFDDAVYATSYGEYRAARDLSLTVSLTSLIGCWCPLSIRVML